MWQGPVTHISHRTLKSIDVWMCGIKPVRYYGVALLGGTSRINILAAFSHLNGKHDTTHKICILIEKSI